MPNPRLLLCDSDALVQLFLAGETRPLKHLIADHGIQPAIVQEVDIELRMLRRYRDRFEPQLEKCLRAGTLKLLDPALFQLQLSGAPTGSSWANFQALGSQYYGRVDRGEAYTFAAAVVLGLPALSNDFSALTTLERNMLAVPTPVLRAFDLLAFCHQTGALTLKECEEVRSRLLNEGEGIPRAFHHNSFHDGMARFKPRLRASGATPGLDGAGFAAVLTLDNS